MRLERAAFAGGMKLALATSDPSSTGGVNGYSPAPKYRHRLFVAADLQELVLIHDPLQVIMSTVFQNSS